MNRSFRAATAAVAAWRLAVLIQQDAITEPLRERFLWRWFPRPNEYVSAVEQRWHLVRSDLPKGGMKWVEDRPVEMKEPPLRRGWEAITKTEGDQVVVMGWQHARGSEVGKMLNCMACLTVWTALAILVAQRTPGLRLLGRVMEVAGGALGIEFVLDALSIYSETHRP